MDKAKEKWGIITSSFKEVFDKELQGITAMFNGIKIGINLSMKNEILTETITSFNKRFVSWLLATKCFTDVPTPLDSIPFTIAAPISPVSKGSSERYSKFLPHKGLR